MASTSRLEGTKESNPTNESRDVLSLHEMFQIVGDQMTTKDVRSLKFLYKRIMPWNIFMNVNDGYTCLLALEKLGRVDETNFKYLLQFLRIITRHDLSQYVTLRRRRTVVPDPVDEYLQHTSSIAQRISQRGSSTNVPVTKVARPADSSVSELAGADHPVKRARSTHFNSTRVTRSQAREVEESADGSYEMPVSTSWLGKTDDSEEIKKKVTCDIRLRVRAEYCDHENALEGNIFSNKPDLLERQFEKFMQANTILKSRDLGSIICDIKFSELTYLDAFWRDYINGSLLEALKGVFITESLKQAVGHEAIKLLVNVDEDDYEAGRVKLLKNLTD